jgi:hypothetical protein
MEPVRFAETLIGFLQQDEILIIDNALDMPIEEAATTLLKILALRPDGDDVAVAVTNGGTFLAYRKSCAEKYQEFISDVTDLSERDHADAE